MSGIDRLPAELVDWITAYLETNDFVSFRLTSRRIGSITYTQFKRRYFTDINVSLDPPTLERFVELTSWPSAAESVQLISISIDDRAQIPLNDLTQGIDSYPLSPGDPRLKVVKKLSAKAQFFEDLASNNEQPQAIINQLAKGFARCTKFQTIRFPHIGDSSFNSAYMECQKKRFRMVLDAMIQSDVKLSRLTMIGGEDGDDYSPQKCSVVPYDAFSFPIPYLLTLGKAFINLKSLHLYINTDYKGHARIPGWETGLSQFLCTAQRLESLSLAHSPSGCGQTFSPPILRSIAKTTNLRSLHTLRLRHCGVHEDDLATLLLRHRSTLRKLALGDLIVRTGTWKLPLKILRDSLNLEFLHLDAIRQEFTPPHQTPAYSYWILMQSSPPWASRYEFLVDASNTSTGKPMFEELTKLMEAHKLVLEEE